VTPERIDLFVDRICGYFPTTNIARNTVKNAWRQEEMLVSLSDEQAKKVLDKIQTEPAFPTLARVKSIIRGTQGRNFSEYCGKCNEGWVQAEDRQFGGYTYRQFGKCTCQGGTYAPAMDLPEVQELSYDSH
jgi:hypothetical protein